MQRVRLRHILPVAILLPLQMVSVGAVRAEAQPATATVQVEELLRTIDQTIATIFENVDAQRREADARVAAARPQPAPPEPAFVPEVLAVTDAVAVVQETISPPFHADLLACIRSFEQGAAGYSTNTGNGYYGAYQFTQGTWNSAVTNAGHPEWSGRRASEAPPAIQDAAAWQLYTESGLGPWPTPQRNC